jgi:phage recombination protein Bet
MSTLPATTTAEKPMEYIPFGAIDKIRLSAAIIQKTIAVATKSGKLPTETDCIKFMMMCQAQRLNPYAGDAFLLGYDGKNGPEFSRVTAHQAFLKRAESSPDFDGMTSGIILVNDNRETVEREGDFHLSEEADLVVGGWAKVFHKKRTHPTYRRIRMARFNKGFAQWEADAAGMIVKCAEADALRSTFPTLLGGLYTAEERDLQSTMATVIPVGTFETPAEPRRVLSDENTPADMKPAPKQVEAGSPQDKISAACTAAGHDLKTIVGTLKESGIYPDADSMPDIGALPIQFAKQIVKNLPGFVKMCADFKAKQG